MTPADTQAALDAATATLATGGFPEAEDHARDVLALVACVSALRDVLAQTERERDEARARIARYVAALDELHASLNEPPPATHEAWEARDRRTSDAHHAADAALAALRETPAGEGGR